MIGDSLDASAEAEVYYAEPHLAEVQTLNSELLTSNNKPSLMLQLH